MRKNKLQLKREATYANLIRAGFEVLCEQGYSSTSLADIVKRAGYTKGAFYVHFESKEQFFLHLVEVQAARWESPAGALAGLPEADLTLEGAVAMGAEALVAYVSDLPEWTLVYQDFLIQARQNEAIRAKFHEFYERWIQEASKFIAFLHHKELVRADLDTVKTAKAMFAFLDGHITHHVFYREPLDAGMMTEVFLKLLRD